MSKLSVVITSHNNQDVIKDCLKSADFADEIIVINNESTDNTPKIAKKLGATVIDHKNNPDNLNLAKNFGFKKAKHEWIMSLDPDERIDSQLKKEIQYILKHTKDIKASGYRIPRKNIIFGKWIEHGLWYPDYQNRLFKKDQGKFACVHNHEPLEIKGKTLTLKGHIKHLNYQTVSQYLQKIDKQYSQNEADTFLQEKNNKVYWYDAIRFPFQDFLTNYFARGSYKDGLHGLVLSLMQAFYMFIVFCKIWEKKGFKEKDIHLQDTHKELDRIGSQIKYWMFLKRQDEEKNMLKKLILKIRFYL